MIPPLALLAVGQAMAEGASKYGDHNWRGLPVDNIINHATRHIFMWLSGDRGEDHLSHAAAGLLMATELEIKEENSARRDDKFI